jgi:hypothetical protein
VSVEHSAVGSNTDCVDDAQRLQPLATPRHPLCGSSLPIQAVHSPVSRVLSVLLCTGGLHRRAAACLLPLPTMPTAMLPAMLGRAHAPAKHSFSAHCRPSWRALHGRCVPVTPAGAACTALAASHRPAALRASRSRKAACAMRRAATAVVLCQEGVCIAHRRESVSHTGGRLCRIQGRRRSRAGRARCLLPAGCPALGLHARPRARPVLRPGARPEELPAEGSCRAWPLRRAPPAACLLAARLPGDARVRRAGPGGAGAARRRARRWTPTTRASSSRVAAASRWRSRGGSRTWAPGCGSCSAARRGGARARSCQRTPPPCHVVAGATL